MLERALVVCHPDLIILQIREQTVLMMPEAKLGTHIYTDDKFGRFVPGRDRFKGGVEGSFLGRKFREIDDIVASICEHYLRVILLHGR